MSKPANKVTKDLTILPIKQHVLEDPKWDSIDHRLPKPPFVLVSQGPAASGKSWSMINMLYNANYYRGMFDSIVIMSPTIENDLSWAMALQDERNTIITGEQLDDLDNLIQKIYDIQLGKVTKALDEGRPPPHMLMIIDDCLGLLGKKFGRICTRHRHPRISIIVSTQDFRAMPLQTRQNASHYMIFKTHNEKELAKIAEEFGGMYGSKRILELYHQATDEPFSFLTLHNRTVKAYKKFDQLLYERVYHKDDKEDKTHLGDDEIKS